MHCADASNLITDDPYNGQVQLAGYQQNHNELHPLKLYLDNGDKGWGLVCARPTEIFINVIIPSVCRQLGFTNYSSYEFERY